MSFSDRSLWRSAQDRPRKSLLLSQGINHTGDGEFFWHFDFRWGEKSLIIMILKVQLFDFFYGLCKIESTYCFSHATKLSREKIIFLPVVGA